MATPWRFESSLGHQIQMKAAFGRFFIVVRALLAASFMTTAKSEAEVVAGRLVAESFDARTTKRKDEAFFEIPIDTQILLVKIAV